MNIAAILLDLGDVIMQEETEARDDEGNTLRAELVSGMGEIVRGFKMRGYKLGLVADTRSKTAWNVLHQHGLYDLFDALAISEQVGCEKPDPRIFRVALDTLKIAAPDYARVVMVGNNRIRDIRGANRLGLISVWFHWNERYLPDPNLDDIPTHEVQSARELDDLVKTLEDTVKN